jgi:hypothetical protein
VRGKFAEQLHQVTQAAAETVQIVAKNNVDLPGTNSLHKCVDSFARYLGARDGVSDNLDVPPVVARAVVPERCKLRIGSLLVGRQPCVNNDSLLHALDEHIKRQTGGELLISLSDTGRDAGVYKLLFLTSSCPEPSNSLGSFPIGFFAGGFRSSTLKTHSHRAAWRVSAVKARNGP